jgi:uncharacterized membrane protein YecN with MAPEG domain
VVLVEHGDLGRYNRANRSLHHFTETSLPVVVAIGLVSQVWPVHAFGLTCAFALGRVLHQIGYSSEKGYGVHAPGFVLVTLTTETLGGLMLIAGLRGFGVWGYL